MQLNRNRRKSLTDINYVSVIWNNFVQKLLPSHEGFICRLKHQVNHVKELGQTGNHLLSPSHFGYTMISFFLGSFFFFFYLSKTKKIMPMSEITIPWPTNFMTILNTAKNRHSIICIANQNAYSFIVPSSHNYKLNKQRNAITNLLIAQEQWGEISKCLRLSLTTFSSPSYHPLQHFWWEIEILETECVLYVEVFCMEIHLDMDEVSLVMSDRVCHSLASMKLVIIWLGYK